MCKGYNKVLNESILKRVADYRIGIIAQLCFNEGDKVAPPTFTIYPIREFG